MERVVPMFGRSLMNDYHTCSNAHMMFRLKSGKCIDYFIMFPSLGVFVAQVLLQFQVQMQQLLVAIGAIKVGMLTTQLPKVAVLAFPLVDGVSCQHSTYCEILSKVAKKLLKTKKKVFSNFNVSFMKTCWKHMHEQKN